MLTGCINGMKGEENRYFRLKTSKLTAYLHPFMLSFTWVCGVKALLLPANLNAFAQKTQVKKGRKVCNNNQHTDAQSITKPLHISRIYNNRDVVYKYAKGEGVFVKKKDNSHSALSMSVSYP